MRRRRRWSSNSAAMASQPGPTSPSLAPAKYGPAATATTITAIGDDLLLEIFLRLPSLPSLVRAALSCRTFLRAVRTCPAFRRRFRALHPPQLLGFFEDPYGTDSPDFVPLLSRSDPDLAAAIRGSDFLLACLPEDSDHSWWEIICCRCGYVVLHNQDTEQIAAYNPISQALDIFPYPPRGTCHLSYLVLHIVFSEEDRRSFRVVCVRRRRRTQRRRALARFYVFSSESREWQVFSWVHTSILQPGDHGGDKCLLSSYTATPVDEFDKLIRWKHKNQAYIVVLNAATLQLSRMDLPPHLKDMDYTEFKLGLTKDGKLSMVFMDHFSANKFTLEVWFWRADGDGVEKWMPHKTFSLDKFLGFTVCSQEFVFTTLVVAVIDGFVYLSIDYNGHTKCLLSFCLKTEKVNKLSAPTVDRNIHPYIMAWPPSLVCNKEDLETKVTVDGLADDGPAGTVSQR